MKHKNSTKNQEKRRKKSTTFYNLLNLKENFIQIFSLINVWREPHENDFLVYTLVSYGHPPDNLKIEV